MIIAIVGPTGIGKSKLALKIAKEVKGEIVCMVYASDNVETDNLISKIDLLKAKGFKAKEISIILSSLYGENKNKIYDLAISN